MYFRVNSMLRCNDSLGMVWPMIVEQHLLFQQQWEQLSFRGHTRSLDTCGTGIRRVRTHTPARHQQERLSILAAGERSFNRLNLCFGLRSTNQQARANALDPAEPPVLRSSTGGQLAHCGCHPIWNASQATAYRLLQSLRQVRKKKDGGRNRYLTRP